MPGTILRPTAMLKGLQWEIPNATSKQVRRLTLFWHDQNGPILTLYAADGSTFDAHIFGGRILNPADQFENVYREGDSQPHKELHGLRDVNGVVENSITADPHVHIQVKNNDDKGAVADANLAARLATTISVKLTALGLIGDMEARDCCTYFRVNGWTG